MAVRQTPNDWCSCDGDGHIGPRLSRRTLLTASAGAAAWWASMSPAWGQAVVGRPNESHEVAVIVFLRGGADGLHIVPPYGEDEYQRARPNLALKKPDVLDIDGHFGFHSAMKSVYPLFKSGEMAVVHAIGSGDASHSHFEAMATMEQGRSIEGEGLTGGWLARYMQANPDKARPMRAMSWGPVLAESLSGAPAISVGSLDDLIFKSPSDDLSSALKQAYGAHSDDVSTFGRHMLEINDLIKKLDPSHAKPERGAEYPKTPTGDAFREAAFLIRQDVGLQLACIDSGGWDSHVTQSYLEGQMRDLADSLGAFHQDLGREMSRVTVVVMSEFGRRVAENAGLGTDHGSGGAMMLLGAGVKGGKMYGQWPGLKPDQLSGPGDLKITTDYRTVLAELLENRLAASTVEPIFPGLNPTRLQIFA